MSGALTRTTPAPADGKAMTRLSAEAEARIAENKVRNAVAAAIRGTMWGKDLSHEQVRAVAEYARQNGIDPVRHVEVLGGRIYLTAALYEERGAALLQRGIVSLAEPDYVHPDPRLDELAKAGDEWAVGEQVRRMRERIKWGIPEKAAAACIQRITLTSTGRTLVGVNWCGGGVRQRDPVGDAEPTKTAATRAARRAWKQVAEVVETFGAQFSALEAAAQVTEVEVGEQMPALEPMHGGARVGKALAAPSDGAYDLPADDEGDA